MQFQIGSKDGQGDVWEFVNYSDGPAFLKIKLVGIVVDRQQYYYRADKTTVLAESSVSLFIFFKPISALQQFPGLHHEMPHLFLLFIHLFEFLLHEKDELYQLQNSFVR